MDQADIHSSVIHLGDHSPRAEFYYIGRQLLLSVIITIDRPYQAVAGAIDPKIAVACQPQRLASGGIKEQVGVAERSVPDSEGGLMV
jgi:hypothetical protein